jgi:hypothetical protein
MRPIMSMNRPLIIDRCSNTVRFKTEIDQLVYKLYDLTPEDIAIVENFNKGK